MNESCVASLPTSLAHRPTTRVRYVGRIATQMRGSLVILTRTTENAGHPWPSLARLAARRWVRSSHALPQLPPLPFVGSLAVARRWGRAAALSRVRFERHPCRQRSYWLSVHASHPQGPILSRAGILPSFCYRGGGIHASPHSPRVSARGTRLCGVPQPSCTTTHCPTSLKGWRK